MSSNAPLNSISRYFGLTRSVTESMMFRFVGLLLVFLLHLILARLMGPKEYGYYSIITSWLSILLVVSLFGMDKAVLRFFPSALAKNDYGMAAGFLRFSRILILVLSFICGVCAFLVILDKSRNGLVNFSEGFFWALFLLPLLAMVYQGAAVLRSYNRIKASMLPVYILLPVFLSIAVAIYYYQHHRLSVDAVMFLQLGCTFLVMLWVRRMVRRKMDPLIGEATPEIEPRVWLSVASAFFLSSIIEMLLKQSDILMVGYLMSHVRAGEYSAASRITSLIAFGISVSDYLYMPKITALYVSGKKRALQEMVRTSARQIMGLTLPLMVLLVLSGPWLLAAFGPTFKKAYIPMLILLAGQLVNAATGLSGALLTMAGNRNSYVLYSFVSFVFQIFFMLLLVPVWGLSGAAVSAALARILLNFLAYRHVRTKIGITASVW